MAAVFRDTRHLAGRVPNTTAPAPRARGLALGLHHEPDGVPLLLIGREDGSVDRLHFARTLNLVVEAKRYCVGNRSDSRWTPCPENRPADRFDRCVDCHPLPNRDCVFNPRCTDCTQEFCRSQHEVYIAYHGKDPKVGMTRQAREGHRLVEQGADAWFLVATMEDRFQARNLEDRVSARLDLPQSVRVKRQLRRLAHPVPMDAIRSHHARLAPLLEGLTGRPSGPLQMLPPGSGRPLREVPVPAAIVGHHAGDLEGAHGRHVFYREAKTYPSVPPGDGPGKKQGVLWALDLKRTLTHPVWFDPQPEAKKNTPERPTRR